MPAVLQERKLLARRWNDRSDESGRTRRKVWSAPRKTLNDNDLERLLQRDQCIAGVSSPSSGSLSTDGSTNGPVRWNRGTTTRNRSPDGRANV